MLVKFTDRGWEDVCYWIDNNPRSIKKIKNLINSIRKDPFDGIGKPELLRHEYSGYWSRRIDKEHRLIYKVQDDEKGRLECTIVQCRFHY